jgi:hypothetical protein
MCERFRMKGQVSRYERFGYGVMMMRLGATAPGMRAIIEQGLLQHIIKVVKIYLL